MVKLMFTRSCAIELMARKEFDINIVLDNLTGDSIKRISASK